MEIRKKQRKTVNVLKDIVCDSCKKSTHDAFNYQYAKITEEFGFGSELDNWDNSNQEFHLCEKCYKKLLKFLKLKRGINNV